jgi:uncharacterized protein YdeI (YjbR/CyaY-like superfamily)
LANKNDLPVNPTFFATPGEFRTWLETHHVCEQELWVGYYKKESGRPSMTWPESVDEALCFGWIDGLRKRIDAASYMIRFTPRSPRSTWSAVNINRVTELAQLGKMQPAGLKAFAERAEDRSGIYAYENRKQAALNEADEQRFRGNAEAWAFFQAQPAGYRSTAIWWVITAKKEETRQSRLSRLIDDSALGRTLREFTRPSKAA